MLQYDPSFAIRGLTIDRERGLLCKISSHQKLCYTGVYRGRQRLSRDEIMELYAGSRHVSIHHRDNKMEPLNDLFSVAHACLFADVVQYLIDADIEYEPIAIVEDVHDAITQVHVSGRMHKEVARDLPKYIEPNPTLLPLLKRIRVRFLEISFFCVVVCIIIIFFNLITCVIMNACRNPARRCFSAQTARSSTLTRGSST